jgi:uncharacterized OsmC-like protein
MAASPICAAIQRVETTLTEKPGLAVHADPPALAVFTGGLAMEVRHPDGYTVATDMPKSLGGKADAVSPGWLMRAGLASCTATVIALRAERLGIRLTRLEVTAGSRSDARGMLGLDPAVAAGPLEIDLAVDVAAEGASEAALAELVAWANQHSPIGDAVRRAMDVRLSVNGKPAAAH